MDAKIIYILLLPISVVANMQTMTTTDCSPFPPDMSQFHHWLLYCLLVYVIDYTGEVVSSSAEVFLVLFVCRCRRGSLPCSFSRWQICNQLIRMRWKARNVRHSDRWYQKLSQFVFLVSSCVSLCRSDRASDIASDIASDELNPRPDEMVGREVRRGVRRTWRETRAKANQISYFVCWRHTDRRVWHDGKTLRAVNVNEAATVHRHFCLLRFPVCAVGTTTKQTIDSHKLQYIALQYTTL